MISTFLLKVNNGKALKSHDLWCSQMESNHRPPLYKSGALTSEPWELSTLLYIALENREGKISLFI